MLADRLRFPVGQKLGSHRAAIRRLSADLGPLEADKATRLARGLVRGLGRRPGAKCPSLARLRGSELGPVLPRFPLNQARGADTQSGAGPPAHPSRIGRPLAKL